MWPKFKLSDSEILDHLAELEKSKRSEIRIIALLLANLFCRRYEFGKTENVEKPKLKSRWPMKPRKGEKKHEESPNNNSSVSKRRG